jgi:hypothetical protein
LAFGASDTSKTFTIKGLRGTLDAILYEQFNSTNNSTGTVAITDPDSNSLFSKSSLADGAATMIQVRLSEGKSVPFDGTNRTLTVTLSGAPGGSGGTIYVTLWVV